MTDTTNAANSSPITAECAANTKTPKRLLGWRTSDYLMETSDREMAQNWQVHHEMLPIFEGDPHTKLAAPQPQGGALTDARKSLESIDKALRGKVNDPDPLPPLHAHSVVGETTTYGLVTGLLRERDALLAKIAKFDQRIVDLGVLAMESAPLAPQQAGDGLTREAITAALNAAIDDTNVGQPNRYVSAQLLREVRGLLAAPRQPATFDTEALIRACVPGGSICDPQQVADAIRAYAAAPHQPDEMGAGVCKSCRGNDGDMPRAYPGEHEQQPHCLSNQRLAAPAVTERQQHTIDCVNSWLQAVGLPLYSAASAQQNEREAFEAWLQPYWSRETYTDPDGDRLYRENWVQGAWIAWQARTSQQVQADAGPVSWRRVAYPDDVCVTKVERDAWLEEGWEVEALYTHPSPAGESDKRERFERFERIKRLALDAGGQGALPVPASLSKIVRECLDGIAAMSREQSQGRDREGGACE